MTNANVIEEYKVLVYLPHIPNVRNHRDIKLPAHQADGDVFRHAAHANNVGLIKTNRSGLKIILENDPVWNVFT